jgi:P pilus assembly chaperone PapD
MKKQRFANVTRLCAAIAILPSSLSPAHAEMVLSQVIVDLQPGKPSHDDIEVWNNGPERIYVAAQPSEVQSPGKPNEQRVSNPDPAVTGLLVTPQRLVLEPDERRVIRVSAVSPRAAVDRIYRVTVKPVAGAITSDSTALKVLIGYDVLVLYRPEKIAGEVTATRSGRKIVIRNDSNTAQELFEGRQCDTAGKNCKLLPATRLYSGATWERSLDYDTPVEYQVTWGTGAALKRF